MNAIHFWQAGVRVMLAGVVLVLVAGCASDKKDPAKAKGATAAQYQPDQWDAGSGRKPTANTMYSLARILIDQGRDRDGLYVLSQIIQEYPRYLPAYNEASSIYVRSGRLKDAETVLRSGLRQEPRDPILNNNLGMVWFLRHDYDQALEHFTNATEVAPDNPTYRANQAAALGMLGRDREALEAYRGVVSGAAAQDNLRVLVQARQRELSSPQAEPVPQSTTQPAPAEMDTGEEEVTPTAPSGV